MAARVGMQQNDDVKSLSASIVLASGIIRRRRSLSLDGNLLAARPRHAVGVHEPLLRRRAGVRDKRPRGRTHALPHAAGVAS